MKYIEIYTFLNGQVEVEVINTKKEAFESFKETQRLSNFFKESSLIELKPNGETSLLAHWEIKS